MEASLTRGVLRVEAASKAMQASVSDGRTLVYVDLRRGADAPLRRWSESGTAGRQLSLFGDVAARRSASDPTAVATSVARSLSQSIVHGTTVIVETDVEASRQVQRALSDAVPDQFLRAQIATSAVVGRRASLLFAYSGPPVLIDVMPHIHDPARWLDHVLIRGPATALASVEA